MKRNKDRKKVHKPPEPIYRLDSAAEERIVAAVVRNLKVLTNLTDLTSLIDSWIHKVAKSLRVSWPSDVKTVELRQRIQQQLQ